MPIMDGVEAIEALRAKHCHIPVVVVTAHMEPKCREQFMAAGCKEFLNKPIERKKLNQVLGRYLRKAGEQQMED